MGVRGAATLLLAVLAPAGARTTLGIAASPGSPEALLEEIDRLGAHTVVSELYLNTIEDSLGSDFHVAVRTVERRARAVASVAEPALAARKRDCLGFLGELKREVIRNRAKWYK